MGQAVCGDVFARCGRPGNRWPLLQFRRWRKKTTLRIGGSLRLALAAAKDRIELHRKEFSESAARSHPGGALMPVRDSSCGKKMTRSLWYALRWSRACCLFWRC